MIQVEKWKWFGSAGHLIVSDRCRFHLCTKVGKYLVSTIGDYYINREDSVPETVGCDRLYETMVFKTTRGSCECGCGIPEVDFAELDMSGYNDRLSANRGHIKMCKKWAKK